MSLNGITGNPLAASIAAVKRTAAQTVKPDGARVAEERSVAETKTPPQNRTPVTAATSAVPVEAPPGTDPALWSVLTTEERNFFSKTAALGPLTYGKIKNSTMPAPPAVRGGRLDVRA